MQSDLSELARLDLTPLDTPEPEMAYLFKHIVTQEVAYESLAYATRAQLHEQLAQYLEAQDASKYLDLLAFHYSRSENVPKQREYLRKAGEAAQAAYANVAALDYYERLLPLLTEPAEQIDIHLRCGEVLLMGRWDEAEAAYRSALSLAEQSGDAAAIARCQHALGELFTLRGDYDAALAWLAQARAGWQALGAAEELGRTLAQNRGCTLAQGRVCRGRAGHLRRPGAGPHRGRTGRMRSTVWGSWLTIRVTRPGRVHRMKRRWRSFARRATSGARQPRSAIWDITALGQRDYAAARPFLEEALVRCREIGDKQGIGCCA